MMQYTAEPLSQVMKGATKQSKKKNSIACGLIQLFFLVFIRRMQHTEL